MEQGTSEKLTEPRMIPCKVGSLASRVEALKNTAIELGERLSPVLRPAEVEKSEDKCQETVTVPLAAELQTNSDILFGVNNFLQDIIDRLEL